MFKKFWLDTITAFLFIVIVAVILAKATALEVLNIFDPVGDAFADMKSTDIVFSKLKPDPLAEENLVLINVGDLPRGGAEGEPGIADLINIINSYEPKVIGMDMRFRLPKADTAADYKLAYAFSQVENLVMYSKVNDYSDSLKAWQTLEVSDPGLFGYGETAFTNFITPAADQDDIKVCREFAVKEKVLGQEEPELAFAVKLAQYIDPEKVDRFLARDNDVERINYKGNIIAPMASDYPMAFFVLDWFDVLENNFVPELIKDKAVVFCYLGSYLGDRKALDDKYFTPLNSKYAGKGHADMFGGVVHANVFSMIMSEDYIDSMSETMSYIIAMIVLYLNIVLFTWIYKRLPKWYDGLSKIIQFIQAFALFTLMLVVFLKKSYELELTTTIVLVLLVGDLLEIYYGVVLNLFTKEGRKELSQLKKM